MPEPTDLRIGDAERDDATVLLQEHLGAGRLTHDEFDERVHRALQATHDSQLAVLFADLPGRRPGHQPVPVHSGARPVRRLPRPPSLAWWVGALVLFAGAGNLLGHLIGGGHPGGMHHREHGPGGGPAVPPEPAVPASGGSHLVWWILLSVLAIAITVVGALWVRRRRRRV